MRKPNMRDLFEREEPIIPRVVREKITMGPLRKAVKDQIDEVTVNLGPVSFTRYCSEGKKESENKEE